MPETTEKRDDSNAQTIRILVKRPAPFWLPSKVERKPDGTKGRPICGKLLLRPGLNRVRKTRWEQTADHPTIVAHIKAGTLVVDPDAREAADHAHAPDSLSGLEDLTVERAKPWIAKQDRVDVLGKWRTQEAKGKNRRTILDAIDDRLEELAAAEE